MQYIAPVAYLQITAVLLLLVPLELQAVLGMLSAALSTVMPTVRSSIIRKLLRASSNSSKDLALDLYIIIQLVHPVGQPLDQEELFNSSSNKRLWHDFNNSHLVDHPYHRVIRYLEHLLWDKADSSLS